MACTENHKKSKTRRDHNIPMTESDDSNEDGFMSTVEELSSIDEVRHFVNALKLLSRSAR